MNSRKLKPRKKSSKPLRSVARKKDTRKIEVKSIPKKNDLEISDLLQILDSDGVISSKAYSRIGSKDLLQAYYNMTLTRMLDDKLIGLQRQGRMGTYVSCAGQEATQIGTVMAVSKNDWIFPMYRDMGMIIQAGVTVKELLDRMFGNSEDRTLGRDLPNLFAWKDRHIVSFAAPIASHLPLAVGFALAGKLRKENLVTIATFGDGATSSAEFHVAMNFAGVYRTPTIFICENNQYAISVPVSQQTASETIAIKAVAYGVKGMRVDGNDLLAVYSSVKDAVDKARNGSGPVLIECVTYRLGSHSTADDWKKYRTEDEVEKWKKRDPLRRLKIHLESMKLWNEEKENELRSRIENEINSTISESEKLPLPSPETLFTDVYSTLTQNLAEQSKELLGK
ncbi:MAG: pyruvate dehydrogenase (acetyl-transferring) E1 component subunit alpha [Nitrososphaerales archaeon]